MPSSKPQFNVRLSPAAIALVAELPAVVGAKLGITVSQADLIQMALVSLAREYGHAPAPAAAPTKSPRKKKGDSA